MKPVFAYIRVSTVKQGEHGSSLTEQRCSIEQFASRHSLTITQWFEEKETAAKGGRTQFTLMLKLLHKGKAAGVIIHKIDRSARNLKDWADLGEMIDKGIEVHFAHESLDMKSRGGRLAADIQAVVAADFIRNLRDEVKKGMRGRLRQGLYPMQAPIGYLDQGGGQPKIPDPVMAPLVVQAFRLYATGEYNLYTLGKEVYGLGLRNIRGGRVTRTGLSTLLNNEFYIGIIHIKRTGERFQGVHEPLISKSLYDSVQVVLQGRTKKKGIKHPARYRKALKCLMCGYSLIPELQKGVLYYRCHTRECPRECVREDMIDAQVREILGLLLLSEEELRIIEREFSFLEKDRTEHLRDHIKSKELGLENLESRMQRLTDAYIDQLLDNTTFEERKAALLNERVALKEGLDELKADSGKRMEKARDFLELIKAIYNAKKLSNEYENRDLLKSVTSNLQVTSKRLVPTWLNPYGLLAHRPDDVFGAPYRDRCRTRKPKGTKKKPPSRFSKKLFNLVQQQDQSSISQSSQKKRRAEG